MSEFDYKQRVPDNRKEFERRYDLAFGQKCPIGLDDNPSFCSAGSCNTCRKIGKLKYRAETTEQKQPLGKN